MTASEKSLFMIRNRTTREAVHLAPDATHAHPSWVHQQLGTQSEHELMALVASLRLEDFLPAGARSDDASGIFVDIPNGALAWKRRDPFQDARWLFDDSEVVEALELDPELVLRITRPDE
jgi:hypothetical protein